jgi:N utilization substance protein A
MLVQNGLMSIVDLSEASTDEVAKILAVAKSVAEQIVADAIARMESGDIKVAPEIEDEIISASAVPSTSAYHGDKPRVAVDEAHKFNDAERRLREELAAFKLK